MRFTLFTAAIAGLVSVASAAPVEVSNRSVVSSGLPGSYHEQGSRQARGGAS